jgi:MraZ protein
VCETGQRDKCESTRKRVSPIDSLVYERLYIGCDANQAERRKVFYFSDASVFPKSSADHYLRQHSTEPRPRRLEKHVDSNGEVGIFGAKWCGVVEDGDQMLLTGAFHRSLDDKLRLAIPKPLRDAIGHPATSAVYVAPGTDGSLEVYAEQAFSQIANKLDQGPRNAKEIRAFHRLFYAQVQRLEIDKHGRIRLPVELAQLSSLEKEIVLLGVGDHIEIWDRQRWEAYLEDTQPNYDQLAEHAFPDPSIATAPRGDRREPATEACVDAGDLPTRPR